MSIVLVGTIIYVLIRLAVKMKNLEQEEQLLPAFVIATFSVSLFLFIAIDMDGSQMDHVQYGASLFAARIAG